MATALLLALSLLATDTTATGGEPLPPGAPTDSYELTGWCFGALGEYLDIYDKVKPDLIDIDKTWGTSVKESEPYASDIAAARAELKVLAGALEAAEKASPRPIAPQGAAAIKKGQSIWAIVESRPRRELARAWLTWGLPDQCATNARTLAAKSALLGKALTYNTKPDEAAPMAPPPTTDGPILQPIAPVTRAAPPPAPTPRAPAPLSANTPSEPPPTGEPEVASAPVQPQPQPTDVASAAPPAGRVVDEGPTPSQPPPASKPPTPAPAAAAPAPAAAPTSVIHPSDESSEPVL
ncbi:MAG TPA: hypothetical protein VFE03_16080 [Caulobacteraceae bacterium]|nr:hypothetical protein [Caulobacteraceae bacterium]